MRAGQDTYCLFVEEAQEVMHDLHDTPYRIRTSNKGWTDPNAPARLPVPVEHDPAVPDWCWALAHDGRRVFGPVPITQTCHREIAAAIDKHKASLSPASK